MTKTQLRIIAACITLVVTLVSPARSYASLPQTPLSSFFVDWSGAEFANGAEAHGIITLNSNLFPFSSNGAFDTAEALEITDFSLTVTGASNGNGSFRLADFAAFSWNTNGTELDWGVDLAGQSVSGGIWGSSDGGDFGFLASSSSAPTLSSAFRLTTANGAGDTISLVSFRPVPVPGAIWLFGSAFAALFGVNRRRIFRC